ncbi:MAG: phosphate ABC transporter substrate-binding protein [Candidatus Zixiibacteriota bacterium]
MKRLFALLAVFAILAGTSWAGKSITIKGSDTMVILGQRWAENFMKTNKDAVIQVTGGGSGTGIAALINGSADIAEASRPMKDKEKAQLKEKRGVDVVEIPTALDGLAVYVHEKNSIPQLTLGQLKLIFQRDVTNWKELGGADAEIVLYSRENNSGTYVYFKEHVLKEEDFSPYCQTLPGTAAIINAVSKDPNSIGYGGIGYSSGVRVVPVATDDSTTAQMPTEENVASGLYPLARYLYWYTAGEPSGEIKQLVDWVLGPDGQALISEVGYYPLPKKKDTPKSAEKPE